MGSTPFSPWDDLYVIGWMEAAEAPARKSVGSSLISAEWFRQLVRNGGTSIPQASHGLLLPTEIASRFGIPENVSAYLIRQGLIRSKRIHGVFEYRLASARAANPEDIAAYLAKRKITFDLRKTALVSEREMHTITGMTHTPIRRCADGACPG